MPRSENVDAFYSIAKSLLAGKNDHALTENARFFVGTLTDWHGEKRYSRSQTFALLRIERDVARRVAARARKKQARPTLKEMAA